MDVSAIPLKAVDPGVLIVLLNWNDAEATLSALDSVQQLDYPAFRVLVVDNGSTDGSGEVLEKVAGERVEFIRLAENTGYTGGCNLGLQRGLDTGAEYVWLLNNDVVVDSGTLSSLVAAAESDPRIGLVSPRISSTDEVPELTWVASVFSPEHRHYDSTSEPEQAAQWAMEHPGKLTAIGTAMLVSVRMVREIGILDGSLFAYWEDIDYSARAVEAGYRIVVDEASMVFHVEKLPTHEPLSIKPHYWYYMGRNETIFWRKHVGLRRSLRPAWWSFHRFLRHLGRCSESPTSCQAILAGLWHGWTGKRGAYDSEYRMPPVVSFFVIRYGRWRGIL